MGKQKKRLVFRSAPVSISQTYHLEDQINPADLFDAMIKIDEVLFSTIMAKSDAGTKIVALGDVTVH